MSFQHDAFVNSQAGAWYKTPRGRQRNVGGQRLSVPSLRCWLPAAMMLYAVAAMLFVVGCFAFLLLQYLCYFYYVYHSKDIVTFVYHSKDIVTLRYTCHQQDNQPTRTVLSTSLTKAMTSTRTSPGKGFLRVSTKG